MALQDEIRQDLQTEVFDAFGKTITLINRSTPIYNTWGDIEDYADSSSTIVAVPYDIFWDRKSSQPFGELKEGEMAIAVPYSETINKEDIFLIESEYFKVVSINKNWLPDNVVTILVLTRAHNYVAGTQELETLFLLDSGSNQLLDSAGDTLKVSS